MTELIFSRLTPPGRAAIATIAVRGPGAVRRVARFFRPGSGRPLEAMPLHRPIHGTFHFEQLAGGPGEEMVVHLRTADTLDLHCHGGTAVVARIEGTLRTLGGRSIAWREWSVEKEADPIRAAAIRALSEATTERTAAILLAQYQGALAQALDDAAAYARRGNKDSARKLLERLLRRAETGLHLVQPWRAVLAGRPNVGKSSLINAMVGFDRVIVHSEPGTTRDLVTTPTAIDGWPVLLVDTAGLRDTSHAVERAGVAAAREELNAADLVLLVFDAAAPCGDEEAFLRSAHPQALVTWNKIDLRGGEPPPPALPGDVPVSAKTGEGVDRLLESIAKRLIPEPPSQRDAVPFTEEQVDAIRKSLAELTR